MINDDVIAWNYQDEVEYNHLKHRYCDRNKLSEDAINKKKAFKDVSPKDHMYHRMAVSAEMAELRVDVAYIVERNNRLENLLGTVSYIHQRLDILEGAYGHQKMLAERCRIEYAAISQGLKDIAKLKEELSNAIKQRSNGPDGVKG